jgi:hypothetical protein
MGIDIGIKLNKKIASDDLKSKFYSYEEGNASDDICCLSRAFYSLVTKDDIIDELNKVLKFDCTFLQEPKLNHVEENDDTKFQFGWVNSVLFLENLKEVKNRINLKSNYFEKMNLNSNWIYYFREQGNGYFIDDINNLIEVIEIGNIQGLTEICYSIG